MRNMSFFLTQDQIRNQTKTVTRRMRWEFLVGKVTLIQPIVKGQGLKKGEKVEKIELPIRVISARREWLSHVNAYPLETQKEGFPDMTGDEFIAMFRKHHGLKEDTIITRIEFEYTESV